MRARLIVGLTAVIAMLLGLVLFSGQAAGAGDQTVTLTVSDSEAPRTAQVLAYQWDPVTSTWGAAQAFSCSEGGSCTADLQPGDWMLNLSQTYNPASLDRRQEMRFPGNGYGVPTQAKVDGDTFTVDLGLLPSGPSSSNRCGSRGRC